MTCTLIRLSRSRLNYQLVRLNHSNVASNAQPSPIQIPESIKVDDNVYQTDSNYNLTPKVLSLLEVGLQSFIFIIFCF